VAAVPIYPYAASEISANNAATPIEILMNFIVYVFFQARCNREHAYLLIQYAIELRPHFVLLCAGDMAIGALVLGLHLGHGSLRFVMIEIEIPPASGGRIALESLTVTSAPLKAPGKYPLPDGSVREPSGFSAGGSISCNSLNMIVSSGNTCVFL
jgi:hypothetical protein